MTDIAAHEEVLRLKRHIAVDLLDRVIGTNDNTKRTKESIWETFEYFFNKLIDKVE